MTGPADPEELARLDVVGPMLADALSEPAWRHVTATLISGGKSNLTFEVTSDAGTVILRRPPTGALLPKAHDMGREARIQQALTATPVPVPPILLACDDLQTGFAFYVMGKVTGHVLRDHLPAGYAGTEAQRRQMTDALVDTLAALHAVDPTSAGLGDFGRPAGFAARQVALWTRQWEAAKTRDNPVVDELAAALGALPAPEGDHTIVHGDYRPDNTVMDPHDPGAVAAVLDWELATLGDPLTDLALMLFYWRQPTDRRMTLIPHLTADEAFPDRAYVRDRYAHASGRDLSGLGFYEALAHLKFAAITQGIAARVDAGAMAGQDFGDLDEEVTTTAEAGLRALHEEN